MIAALNYCWIRWNPERGIHRSCLRLFRKESLPVGSLNGIPRQINQTHSNSITKWSKAEYKVASKWLLSPYWRKTEAETGLSYHQANKRQTTFIFLHGRRKKLFNFRNSNWHLPSCFPRRLITTCGQIRFFFPFEFFASGTEDRLEISQGRFSFEDEKKREKRNLSFSWKGVAYSSRMHRMQSTRFERVDSAQLPSTLTLVEIKVYRRKLPF